MLRMQDEISMGFDRLIAMASEVDKRRKSAENSPVQVAANTLVGFWFGSPFNRENCVVFVSHQWTICSN